MFNKSRIGREGKTQVEIPARLKAEEAGAVLGFEAHDIPILVSNKLLKPLGKPVPNATKYFAAVEIIELAEDPNWLNKATQTIYNYWAGKNGRKIKRVSPPEVMTEQTALAE